MGNQKEIWKAILIDGKKPVVPYVISSQGRFGVMTDGKVEVRTFKPTAGNYRYNTRQRGVNKAIFLHKEVAKAFLNKPSPKHKFIIHKDHNYLNNHPNNLKWATLEEHRKHTTMSPKSILARKRKAITKSLHSQVFNEKSVAVLKRMIWDPKRKLSFKQLAEKFGVSEMQIYRIKNGDFWYHVRVENEPLHPKYTKNLSNIEFQEKKAEREDAEKLRREKAKSILAAKKKERERSLIEARKKALAAKKQKAIVTAKSMRLLKVAKVKKAKSVPVRKAKKTRTTAPRRRAAERGYTLVKLTKRRR